MIFAGCPTPTEAWVGVGLSLIYTAGALVLVRKPERIRGTWRRSLKRLVALLMVGIGCLFLILLVKSVVTNECSS